MTNIWDNFHNVRWSRLVPQACMLYEMCDLTALSPEEACSRTTLAAQGRTFLWEFWLFGIKQASASLFGAYLLGLMILTKYWYPWDGVLYRYDFLLLCAVGFQLLLLVFRLETWREGLVILIFHIVATAMEIFKTSEAIQAWHYPGHFVLGIGNVPLFAGFMYSAVGSYIARVSRIFEFRYSGYPPKIWTWILVVFIYMNFFTHHYFWDLREVLLAATLLIYGRCRIFFRMNRVHRWMPLLLGFFLVALFIWFAENIATYCGIWLYPSQEESWSMVPFSKLIAWFLLMMMSFVLVTLVNPPRLTSGEEPGLLTNRSSPPVTPKSSAADVNNSDSR